MEALWLVVLLVIPPVGLAVLWILLNRWGRRNDPMKPSDLSHYTPGAEGRRRSSLED